MTCQRPDRDVPGLVCGHPLPCPYHTAVLDTTGEVPTMTIPVVSIPPVSPGTLRALKQISTVIHTQLGAKRR